ncbi:hypothetical protein JVT61DRAFT_13653 [Boletus reticuloceps]|uniref:Uncharacterized protein n=1 Tax=Boletus reticuloceps TaxID=495285 RepID=A0A8I3A3L8_9AGAM|nr:hypothetical protein JVT61DRAFT_13653 [Boletus reticuloceps]
MVKVQAAHDSKVLPTCTNPKAINQAVTAPFSKMDQDVHPLLLLSCMCSHMEFSGQHFVLRPALKISALQSEELLKIMLSQRFSSQRKLRNLCTQSSTWNHTAWLSVDHQWYQTWVTRKVKMNYTNNELHIIERHGIALIGWPVSGCVCNPSKICDRQEVKKLLSILQVETCKWMKLTDKQLASQIAQNKAQQATGKQVYYPQCMHGSNSSTTSKKIADIDTFDKDSDD